MKSFTFKGLMVPVLTPFNEDKHRTVNYDVIEKYAAHLKQKGMHGVMVNGLTGEGMTLRCEERKRLAEEWFKVTRKHQMTMLLNIGGTNVADVLELAEHADKLGVDAIMVLPDLFFRPAVEEDLMHYIREVAKHAPSTPVMYYHIPMMTDVRMRMWRLCDMAEKEITNFAGVYYADPSLDRAVDTMKPNRKIIMTTRHTLLGALTMGMDAISMIAMNVMPEMVAECYEHMMNNRLKEAMIMQEKLMKRTREILGHDQDMVVKMKMEFNKLNASLKMGPTRKPMWNETMMRMM